MLINYNSGYKYLLFYNYIYLNNIYLNNYNTHILDNT